MTGSVAVNQQKPPTGRAQQSVEQQIANLRWGLARVTDPEDERRMRDNLEKLLLARGGEG